MTTVAEIRAGDRKAAAEGKRSELLARGYTVAGKPTRCALCTGKIPAGQYVAKMPASWQVSSPRRHAHHACFERLQEWVRARAAGDSPAALIWKARNAGPGTPPRSPRTKVTAAARTASAAYSGDGPKAAEWVAQYLRDNGTGPLWAELRRGMGWPSHRIADSVIRDLAHGGWLSFSREERSLRPGPAAQSGAPK